MNTAASTAWLTSPVPFCAACMEHRVEHHALYFCPRCTDEKPAIAPAPRMPLDRPTTISTSAGEL